MPVMFDRRVRCCAYLFSNNRQHIYYFNPIRNPVGIFSQEYDIDFSIGKKFVERNSFQRLFLHATVSKINYSHI